LLLYSATQMIKSSLIKISSRRAGPGHLPMAWCFIPLFRPLGLVISFIIRLDVINTIYFTIYCFMCET
jgi:hypothetical protein